MNIAKFLKNTFFTEQLRWLLLPILHSSLYGVCPYFALSAYNQLPGAWDYKKQSKNRNEVEIYGVPFWQKLITFLHANFNLA